MPGQPGQPGRPGRPGAPRRPGLHVVYRSCAAENGKARPAYYHKGLALASLLRAVEAVRATAARVDVSFLNDGTPPAERLTAMRRSGRLVDVAGGTARRAYRAALAWTAHQEWPAEDLVWFAEDDYLYAPDALVRLLEAAALPAADYLSLWGHLALDTAARRSGPPSRPLELSAGDPGAVLLQGVRWYRQTSTTSTFGVRVGVLREDLVLLRVAPYSGGAWDHTTGLMVQGRRPYTWHQVGASVRTAVLGPDHPWDDARPRAAARATTRTMVNVLSRRRPGHVRRIYASDPQMVFHMELPDEARGDRCWADVAARTVDWAAAGDPTLRALCPTPAGQDMSGPPPQSPLR